MLKKKHRRRKMKGTAVCATLFGIAPILVVNSRPSEAWVYASDLYPYCQLNSSSEAGMSCYLSSMNQCEYRESCIPNPRYLGAAGAREWKRENKPQWRWW
jgi:hypothetical protein